MLARVRSGALIGINAVVVEVEVDMALGLPYFNVVGLPEGAVKESKVRVAERGYGKIHRAFELPDDASRDQIEASYKDGVLDVKVAKKAESKSAKIIVN